MPVRPMSSYGAGAKDSRVAILRGAREGCISECLGVRFVTISACTDAAAQLYTLVNVYVCM